MTLNKLSAKDKPIFNQYLSLASHELSVYAFENIYIWKGLFDIKWQRIGKSLCIFFQDKIGTFLYLSPLARIQNPEVLKEAFEILDKLNKNKNVSRIENVEEKDLAFYQDLGYACKEKSYDYLCLRSDLVKLTGNKFKSKRASLNYFIKHYAFEFLPFSIKYRDGCLKLYNCWMTERKTQTQDRVYLGMLEDSRSCLKIMLDNYAGLDLIGRVVKVDREIKAFTFGFKLNPDTFCILYEITELSIKGLAQFIFAKFCSELREHKYINIMDDSGLENLKKVKLSYQPVKLVPAYIITRNG